MKQWFKEYWWIPTLILVGGFIVWAYFYFSKPENKIKFAFTSNDNLSNLLPVLQGRYASAGADAERGLGIYLDVPLTAIIKNKSAKEVVLNNIAGALSYEGENILQTSGNSKKLDEVRVSSKSQTPVTDTFQVLVNGKTIKYVKELLSGKKPKLGYNLNALVGGQVYNFRDSTVLNADAPSASSTTSGRG